MKYENILSKKCNLLADKCLTICYQVKRNHHEFELTRQLIRSVTSIGANYAEAQNSLSRKGFIARITVCRRECAETLFWLDRFMHLGLIDKFECIEIKELGIEVFKLLNASYATARKKV